MMACLCGTTGHHKAAQEDSWESNGNNCSLVMLCYVPSRPHGFRLLLPSDNSTIDIDLVCDTASCLVYTSCGM